MTKSRDVPKRRIPAKSAPKQPESETVGRLETPAHGKGKLMRGNPGQRKGGRYSKRFKRWCQLQLEHADTKRAIRKARRKAAKDGDLSQLLPLMNTLAKYGHHELTQQRDLKLTSSKELLDTLNEAVSSDE